MITPRPLGRLGFGAASLGNLYRPMTDDHGRAIVDAAWDGGVRYFDTAPHYGLGLSERRLGAALRERPRAEFVISTKVGRLLRPTAVRAGATDEANGFAVPAAYVRVWDPSPAGIARSLEESRERLGLSRIDVAFLHDPEEYDLDAGLTVGLPALAAHREAGELAAVGVGSKSVPALIAAVRTGCCDVIMVAGRLTLLDRSALDELVPLCRRHGVVIIAVGVFNSGALAAERPGREVTYEYAPIGADRLAQLERVHATCARYGVRTADAAVQYPLRVPEVINVAVGADSASQLAATLAGLDAPIPPGLWDELDALR